MTISGAITPPTWWVTRLQGRVKMGAGRAPVPPGMFRQADLLAKILEDCGNEHTAPEMSRALKGERIPRPGAVARVLLLVEQIADAYEGRIEIAPTAHWPDSLDASADAC